VFETSDVLYIRVGQMRAFERKKYILYCKTKYIVICVFNDLSVARNGTNVWGVRNNGYITKGTNIVGIASISKNIPVNFSLRQNYPNPFNPSTRIRYDVPQNSFVKLVVYDILGREVSVLVNEHLKPGEYEAVWTADNMPSGVYFYNLTANGFSETKKMLMIK
jgi:Secretion system C-terminal sorting domain